MGKGKSRKNLQTRVASWWWSQTQEWWMGQHYVLQISRRTWVQAVWHLQYLHRGRQEHMKVAEASQCCHQFRDTRQLCMGNWESSRKKGVNLGLVVLGKGKMAQQEFMNMPKVVGCIYPSICACGRWFGCKKTLYFSDIMSIVVAIQKPIFMCSQSYTCPHKDSPATTELLILRESKPNTSRT